MLKGITLALMLSALVLCELARRDIPEHPMDITGKRARLGMISGILMLSSVIIDSSYWCVVWRKNRRLQRYAAEGRCLACGYDLRASPQRCPECGTPKPE